MLVPAGTNIVTFVNKYFVDAAICTDLVTDEDVRILWFEEGSASTGNPSVNKKKLSFDIYVKRERLNDASNDALRSRARMISQKLQEMLTYEDAVGRITFGYVDDYSLGTRMVGYIRHRLTVSYMAGHV